MANILRNLSYGVYVISSIDTRPVGCIANAVMQITSDPKTVAISINHDNYTNEIIKKTGKFAVSILNEDIDPEIIGIFGYKSSRDVDKFKDFPHEELEGIPVITDAIGAFTCEVTDTLETSTHTIFLGTLKSEKTFQEGTPMTYKYYHDVKKGKSPKNAPTYEEVEDSSNGKKIVWRCPLCGYEIETDELPDDFKCPICGVGKETFERIER